MTRILFVISSSVRGGAQISLLRLVSKLDKTRFEVLLYCPEGFFASAARGIGLNVITGGFGFTGIATLSQIICRQHIERVNTSLLWAAVITSLAILLSGARPVLTVTVNNGIATPGISRIRRFVKAIAYRFIDMLQPLYLVKSQRFKEELLGMRWRRFNKVLNIDNPVMVYDAVTDKERNSIRSRLGIAREEVAIGVVAAFDPLKGHAIMLEALESIVSHNAAVRVHFVGDGFLRQVIEAEATRSCIGHVHFAGEVEDPIEYIRGMDIVVVPSLSEGMSNALLEAMALGRPVVATAVGESDQIIKDRENGILVDPGNAASLSDGVCWLLDNPQRAIEMGVRARDHVRKRFSEEVVVRNFAAILDACGRNEIRGDQEPADRRTVLHVVLSSDVGGAQSFIASFVRESPNVGLRNVVVCPYGPLYRELRRNKCEVYRLEYGLNAPLRLLTMVRNLKPAVIHYHLFRSVVSGILIQPFINRSAKIVYTAHNMPIYPGMHNSRRILYSIIMKIVVRGVDSIVALSDEMKDYFVEIKGVPNAKVRLIHNGVAFENLEEKHRLDARCREEAGIPRDARVLGTIGRLSYEKGQDVFLGAYLELAEGDPSLHCLVVGDGPQRSILSSMVQKSGREATVHFVGYQEDVLSWFGAMDLVVFASRTEGFPMTAIEAAYAGKPIIATEVGGVNQILFDGRTGIIIAPENPVSLVAAARKILDNPILGGELGRAARESVIGRLDMKECRRKTFDLYSELLSSTSPN